MGALIILAGLVFLIYQGIKSASEPVNKGFTDFEKMNRDVISGQYSKKEIERRANRGMYNTDKKPW